MMKVRRTYYPTKVFDDMLFALVQLLLAKGWSFPGASTEQLVADVEAQRAERAEHDALMSRFLALHETFGMNQEARYGRFVAVLNAARGAFRTDKAVMAELDRFKRPRARPQKPKDDAEAA
ncbi:MAG: hypothetical protein M0R80_22500 [Proteobacteria bacterium]|jgi:hypothetical protein|nr:hypothetical protein [Pseudomonadota bacterium]